MTKEVTFNLSLKTMNVGQLVSLPIFMELIQKADRTDIDNANLSEAISYIADLTEFEQSGLMAAQLDVIAEKVQQAFKIASYEFGQIMANPKPVSEFAACAISDADVVDNNDKIKYNNSILSKNTTRIKKLKTLNKKNLISLSEKKRKDKADRKAEIHKLQIENRTLLAEIETAKKANKLQRGQMFYVRKDTLNTPLAFWLKYFQNVELHINKIPKEKYWMYWQYITPVIAMMAWRKDEMSIIERGAKGNAEREIDTGRIAYFSDVFLKMNAEVACNLFAFFFSTRMPNLKSQFMKYWEGVSANQQVPNEKSTQKTGAGMLT